MFVKKLLVRLLVIVFLAGITVVVFAANYVQDVDWADNVSYFYAAAKKMVGDSTLHAVAKGKCTGKSIKNGFYELNAYAPGGAEDPGLKKGDYNGEWNLQIDAWGHNNSSDSYGATSKVGGTDKYGTKDGANASI